MATIARHDIEYGHNHDHNATNNDNSTVTITNFSTIIIVARTREEYLVPGYQTVLHAHPMLNYQFSPIASMSHISLFALQLHGSIP